MNFPLPCLTTDWLEHIRPSARSCCFQSSLGKIGIVGGDAPTTVSVKPAQLFLYIYIRLYIFFSFARSPILPCNPGWTTRFGSRSPWISWICWLKPSFSSTCHKKLAAENRSLRRRLLAEEVELQERRLSMGWVWCCRRIQVINGLKQWLCLIFFGGNPGNWWLILISPQKKYDGCHFWIYWVGSILDRSIFICILPTVTVILLP